MAPRKGDGFDVWIILNMDGKGGRVTLPRQGYDELEGSEVQAGLLNIAPFGYKAIRFA
ncbi:Beta-galactosidase YesZ [compost metagenome]